MSIPRLQAGQQWRISLRFTRAQDGVYNEVFPAIVAVRATIGLSGMPPESGSYRLEVAGHITAPLWHNATAAQVAAALNALGVGVFKVESAKGSYLIRRNDGAQVLVTPRNNQLIPASAVRVRAYEVDHEWVHELQLVQAPVAFTDAADQVLPPPPEISTLVDGFTAPDNTWFINEVQQLAIPQEFRGFYRLTFDYQGGVGGSGLPRRTRILSLQDGPAEVEEALNAIFKNFSGFDGQVSVSNPGNNVARLTFGGEAFEGVDLPPLEVEALPVPGDEGDWTFTLDLNRAELWAALRAQDEVTMPFEVEMDVLVDRRNPSRGHRTVKLWSLPVTLVRPVLFEGLAEARPIDWLRPISPRSYLPFSPDSIITGQQHWVGTIGPSYGTAVSVNTINGAEVYTIDHNLASEALHVTVRRNQTPGDLVQPDRVTVEGPDSVSVAFGTAVTESYGVVITAAGPRSVFQAHTHTIGEVDRLVDILENFAERIEKLERLLPKAGVAGVTAGPPASYVLPAVGEILPNASYLDGDSSLASQLVRTDQGRQDVPAGTDVADQQEAEKAAEEESQKDPEALPPGVVYRVSLPGIGAGARKGQRAEVDERGNVLVPAVADEPAAPQLWPGRSVSMARGGRWPLLLPAADGFSGTAPVETAVEAVPSALAGSTLAPLVYRNNSLEPLMLPGGSGRRSQVVPPQGLFADDGRCFYRVLKGAGDVYYPAEMERELWRVALTDVQFPNGALLTAGGEIRIQMLGDFFDDEARGVARVDYAGQYFLQCEAVPLEDSSATLGRALEPVVIGRTRVALSPAVESFRWSLSILREAEATTASWFAYGKISDLTAVLPLPAVLRLRLTGFDVDNASEDNIDIFDPRGQIALIAPSSRLQIRL
jgi:hypothetical protein